jgi:two-component system, NtrC family, sensor kinase
MTMSMSQPVSQSGSQSLLQCELAPSIVVLLIDDQAIVAEVVRRTLSLEADIKFHYCSDPTQAIAMALAVRPTVILQDLVMPEIDGMMLLRWFRMNPETAQIPMIVLSNKEDAVMKAAAFTAGANDYLIKLPDPIELVARIRYHSQAYGNLKALNLATITAQAQTRDLAQALGQLQDTQAQLIQTEKMSGLGQMVAGIAHEINNPINFIHGNIKHVRQYVDDLLTIVALYEASPNSRAAMNAEVQAHLQEFDIDFIQRDTFSAMASMETGVERIVSIVKSLRNFARLDENDQKEVDLHEGLESTCLLLQHRLGSNIAIQRDYSRLPKVQCYPAQLNQVFMHILHNAIDALKDVSLINQTKQITIRTQAVGTDRVNIEFQDNGPGIATAIQSDIFNPFFTTKAVNSGKGLGLSVAYRIVHAHQGNLSVVSTPSMGATFAVELPIVQSSGY